MRGHATLDIEPRPSRILLVSGGSVHLLSGVAVVVCSLPLWIKTGLFAGIALASIGFVWQYGYRRGRGFIARLEKDTKSGYDFNARFVRPPGDLGIETNCANYAQGDAAPTQDEEDFFPDIYNDQLNEDGSIPGKPKKPDDTFGDQLDGGN